MGIVEIDPVDIAPEEFADQVSLVARPAADDKHLAEGRCISFAKNGKQASHLPVEYR